MSYKTVEAEIYIPDVLSEASDDELLAEMKLRKWDTKFLENELVDLEEKMFAIWQKRRLGQDYQKELDDLIYHTIGKIL